MSRYRPFADFCAVLTLFLFPLTSGAIFLLSKWYKKEELGFRTAILYCGALISNAFGPLIAAGILARFHWRYLFYIEGGLFVSLLPALYLRTAC